MINEIYEQVRYSGGAPLSDSDARLYQQFIQRMARMDDLFEINSYINECYGQRDNQDFILQRGPFVT